MSDARLALLRELERADEEVARVLDELDALYATVEDVRRRALELETFFARLHADRVVRREAVEREERSVAGTEETARRAADELRAAEDSGDPERIAAARRFDVRTRDALSVARRRLRAATDEEEQLEAQAAEATRSVPEVEEHARRLAASLAERPRLGAEAGTAPAPGLAGVSEWGGRARAALLVARASLAGERDAVIRQANELGALVLGEPLTSARASDVARRVERALEAR